MAIFHLSSYRSVIEQKIRENSNVKGYRAHLSKSMGIQTSHFSQVMSGKIDLSADQGSRLCDEWRFNDLEADYFLHLIHYERATSISLKRRLSKHMENIRRSMDGDGVYQVSEKEMKSKDFLAFFSNWVCPAVYALMRVPHIRSESELTKRLELPSESVRGALQDLLAMELIEEDGDWWKPTKIALAFPSRKIQSFMHDDLRRKAHEIYTSGNTEIIRLGYMSLIPENLFFKLRTEIETFIDKFIRETSEDIPESHEIAVLNLDFFRVGKGKCPT